MAAILIIEPDEQLAAELSEAIEQAGLRTIVQDGGSGVTDLLAVDPPALIVLDLAVDDGQGVALCHKIRDSSGGELLPILMVGTGAEGIRSFGEALAEGGDYYFDKPVEILKLVSKIRTYVGIDRDSPTVVGKPPAKALEAKPAKTKPALADRVEQMLDLGESFQTGMLAPPEGPLDRELTQPSGPPPGVRKNPPAVENRTGLLAQDLFDDDLDADEFERTLLNPPSVVLAQSPGGLQPPVEAKDPTAGADETPLGVSASFGPARSFPSELDPIESRQPFLKEPDEADTAGGLAVGQATDPDEALRRFEEQLMSQAAEEIADGSEQELLELEARLIREDEERKRREQVQPEQPVQEPQGPVSDRPRESERQAQGAKRLRELQAEQERLQLWKLERQRQIEQAEQRRTDQAARELEEEQERLELWEFERQRQIEQAEQLRAAQIAREREEEQERLRLWEQQRQRELELAEQRRQAELERLAREEEQRRTEEERKAQEERRRKQEQERKLKEEQERKRKEEQERKRKEEQGRKLKEEQERKLKEEQERQRKWEQERRRKWEQERRRHLEESERRRNQQASERKDEKERRREEQEEPLAAEALWSEALEDIDGVDQDQARDLAIEASSWMEDHFAREETSPHSAFERLPTDGLEQAPKGETEHSPTSGAGESLVRLLEREARLARERAGDEDGEDWAADGEDVVGTIPDLPPRPGEGPTRGQVRPGSPIDRALANRAAGFDREDTEDLPALQPRDRAKAEENLEQVETPAEQAGREPLRVPVRRPGLRVVKPGRPARPGTGVAKRPKSAVARSELEASPDAGTEREELFAQAEEEPLRPPQPESGDIEDEMVPALLWRMYCQQVTGLVDFRSGRDSKQVLLERGVPVGVRSSQTADRLEELLFREGLIDREAYAEARVKGLTQARALAAHLVERGMLRPEELFPLVRRHLEYCLLGLFEWRAGSVGYRPERALDAEKVRLARPVSSLLAEGIRLKFLLPRMMEALGGPASLLAPLAPEDRPVRAPSLDDLGLQAQEREVLRLVDGMRPVEELVFLSGRDVETVYRVLLVGVVTGLVAVAVRGLHPLDGDPSETQKRDLEISRRRLEAKFEQINRASYFEILGVGEQASPYEIRTAHERLAREFHSMHFAHPVLKDLASKLDIVQRTLAEARDVLSDDLLRAGYRSALKDKA